MALLTHFVTGVATAEGGSSSISTIVTSMQTSFTSITSEMMTAIGGILPIVLPIVGAVAVIFLGVRLFKRLSNK